MPRRAATRTTKARRGKKTKRAKQPARRTPRWGAGLWLRAPVLQQRELDLVGLALVAVGVFLAFVLYLGGNGGQVGHALIDGSRYLVGAIAYALPLGVIAAGTIIVLRPVLPASRPFGLGGAFLLAALTLGSAAGTFGLGAGGARAGVWERAFVAPRGGLLGEALYSALYPPVQSVGVHIVTVFLCAAGVLLVTGATIAGVVHALRSGVMGTGRVLRDSTAGLTAALARRPDPGIAAPDGDGESVVPPEPEQEEVVVRATHVEAPPLDAATRFPDLFGGGRDPNARAAAGTEPTDAVDTEHPPAPELEAEQPGVTRAEPAPARPSKEELTPQGSYRESVTADPGFNWNLPDARMLKRSKNGSSRPDTTDQKAVAAQLLEALGHFGVEAKVINTVVGPHITRYELRLAPGTKVGKVSQLKDDLAYSLAADEIRILAPIPGKQAVGVEVPNERRRIVHLGDVFQDSPPDWSPLTIWLGKDVAGRAIGADISKLAHLLIAGTTGSGKSGCINAILSSILLRATPHQVRMVLVDPKRVELNHYDSIPHLLTPVITDPRLAKNALGNLVTEMEKRYGIMSLAGTRNLAELNRARIRTGDQPLPYVLCVIDELADLMMVAPVDVEDAVIRLAQKARAVGIHLVLATQSPRVDVITGMIKANVPSRIAFAVSSQTDSRVILDQNGAESLLGEGDMLFSPIGSSRLQRILGAYVDEDQIAKLTSFWRRQGEPEFHEELLEEVESEDDGGHAANEFDEDPVLEDAIALVVQMGTASTSMLQRRLRLGYARAGRVIDMLERRGVISGYEGSKPRQVLITEADLPRVLANLSADAAREPVTAESDDS